ncbi:hypothetical protein [Psychrobacter sp. DAB_AL43B]|uniref:hypothetical protein n=1 Tax=Psychrobacter sp. DAB_AL43B TaxID=1028416 RepID=UPI0009A634CC|nr:hypothetical protein [Psychrobacter sp. DAB_AL43B]SLJ85975.1 hypothetical protein DABAL43B_2811 [Psychrobacter sp. DAB_AL43B]
MKTDNNLGAYPYLQVVILFAGISSVVGGLIAELVLLFVFRNADFAQIGYQPLIYVGLLGFIPALLTGIVIASQKIWRGAHKSIRTTFLVGFITSAIYMGAIVLYLGINSWIEVGVLVAFMAGIGLFGAVNSAVASCIALPKVCKSRFDISTKKEDDGYKGLSFTEQ